MPVTVHSHRPAPFDSFMAFLRDAAGALHDPPRVRLLCRRLKASEDLLNALSPNDLALALLLTRPLAHDTGAKSARPHQTLAPPSTTGAPETSQEANHPTSARQYGAELLQLLERQKAFSSWARQAFPELPFLAPSDWAPWILPHWDDIHRAYGDDDPFLVLDGHLRQFFRPEYVPSPWHPYRTTAHPHSERLVQETVLDLANRLGPALLGAFPLIAEVYAGKRPPSALPPLSMSKVILSWHIQGEDNVHHAHLGPLLTEILSVYLDDTETLPSDHPVIANILRRLTVEATWLAGECVECVTDVLTYLERASDTETVLLPNWSLIIEDVCIGDHLTSSPADDLFAQFFDAVLAFQRTGHAPDGLLPTWCFRPDFWAAPLPKAWHLPFKLAEIFGLGDYSDFDLNSNDSWNDVCDVLGMLREQAQHRVSDALLAAYLYLRVLVIRKAMPSISDLLSEFWSIPADSRRLTERTLTIIRKVYPDVPDHDGHAKGLVRAFRPTERLDAVDVHWLAAREMPDDEELESHLVEVLSERVWDALSDQVRGDLLQGERQWEFLRRRRASQRDKEPERAIFQHWGCAIEGELKRSLEPILNRLQAWFAQNPTRKDDPLSDLQKIAGPHGRTLGSLVILLAERKDKKKLGRFPEYLEALNRSQLVSKVFKDDRKRDTLRNLADLYRNPASHAQEKSLGHGDAIALREIVYRKGLFRELVEARLDGPITV